MRLNSGFGDIKPPAELPFVTVALVDRFGTVQALLRGDNAAAHTIEAAKQKAYTAAAFGAPTSELAKRVNGNGAPPSPTCRAPCSLRAVSR
jgi:uncharacterized protein GlcG (DUF336 family)